MEKCKGVEGLAGKRLTNVTGFVGVPLSYAYASLLLLTSRTLHPFITERADTWKSSRSTCIATSSPCHHSEEPRSTGSDGRLTPATPPRNGVTARPRTRSDMQPRYAEGEKVLCYHGPLIYLARVRSPSRAGVVLLVKYTSYNARG